MKKHLTAFFFAFMLMVPSFAEELTDAQKEVQKRVATIKKLDKRISSLDSELIGLQKEFTTQQQDLEALEIKEAKVREQLKEDLDKIGLLARNMARVERLPLEAMGFAEGTTLRENHKRIGIIAQSRKNIANNIEEQRKRIVTLQEIRTEKEGIASELHKKQITMAQHREKLQDLFETQIKQLRLSDKNQAKLLEKSRSAAKKAKNLNELASLANTHDYEVETNALEKRYHKGLPVLGTVTKTFGERNNVGVKTQGITIETTTNEPVKVLADGRVIYSSTFREYGHIIIVEHDHGVNSLYSGLNKSTFKVGDYTRAGQTIGLMPNTQSPELYLEVRKSGETIDPIRWIEKQSS